jgi:hypothetical protein
MAAWMTRDDKPARPKAAVLCGCLLGLAAVCATPHRAQADGGVIYVDAAHGYSSADLASDLRQSLAEKFNYTLAEAETDQAVLERVAADPRNIGFVQRDHYVQYLRDHGDDATRFEFYGNIPACLIVVVRKGTQLQTYGDLVRARADRPTTLDIGPTAGQLAATFGNLRQMDGSLAQLALQHRGGARALGQVMTGETDAALFLVLAPFTDRFVAELINSDAVDLVPFFSEEIVIGASRGKLPYVLRQIRLGASGWFSSGRPYHTTCTSIGAVVNAQADVRLSEKVAQVLLQDASARAPRPWPVAIGSAVVTAFTEVERFLAGGVEVVTAWLGFGAPVDLAIAAAPGAAPRLPPNVRDVSDPLSMPPRGSAAARP